MKKILFLFCIISLGLASCKAQEQLTTDKKDKQKQNQKNNPPQKQDKPKEKNQNKFSSLVKDTTRIIVDSILYGKQQIELNQKLQEAILKKLEEGEKDKTIEWLIPLVVSAIFGIAAFFFSQMTMKRDKRYRDLAFIAEVDKLLIEHPELRGYDNNYISKIVAPLTIASPVKLTFKGKEKITIKGTHSFIVTPLNGKTVNISSGNEKKSFSALDNTSFQNIMEDKDYEIENDAEIDIRQCSNVIVKPLQDDLTNAKIRSFCYYILNNFELALMHQTRKSIQPWKNYLKHTYNKSNQFKELVKNAQSKEGKNIFSTEFVKQLDELFPMNKTN